MSIRNPISCIAMPVCLCCKGNLQNEISVFWKSPNFSLKKSQNLFQPLIANMLSCRDQNLPHAKRNLVHFISFFFLLLLLSATSFFLTARLSSEWRFGFDRIGKPEQSVPLWLLEQFTLSRSCRSGKNCGCRLTWGRRSESLWKQGGCGVHSKSSYKYTIAAW